jgi:hypothetical protein
MEEETNFSTQQNQKTQNLFISPKNKKIGTLYIIMPFLSLAAIFLLYALVNMNAAGAPGPSMANKILGIFGFVCIFGIFIGFYLGYKKLTKKEPTDLTLDNRSGEGKNSVIPKEIKKWNWGAAGLTWIWGVYHGVWVAMIVLVSAKIPFASLIVTIFLGIKGNELAWKAKKYESVEKFLAAQNKWKKWGIIILVLQLIFVVVSYL